MEQEIKRLRRLIESTEKNQRGHRRFDKALRASIVELAAQWTTAGGKLATLAAELGMHDRTLALWWQASGPRTRVPLRAVAVEPSAPAATPDGRAPDRQPQRASGAGVVVLPSGVRIEGLSVPELAELVRQVA